MCNPSISSYVNEDQIAQRENMDILGPRHEPYPFETYIEEIASTLDDFGFDITDKCIVLSHKGDRLFGSFAVEDRVVPSEQGWCRSVVGFRASHDQSVSQQINAGDWVLMCDNMLMGGSLGKYRTKQTTYLYEREESFVSSTIEDLRNYNKVKSKRYQYLIDTHMTDKTAHDLFVRVFRAGGINKGQLASSIEEYHAPMYNTFYDEPTRESTAWGAWNAMTSSIQGSSPTVLISRSRKITETVDKFFNIEQYVTA